MPNGRKEALDYHAQGRPGKIEVVPTKSVASARDLWLAYSPGVAEPCREIRANPDDVYKYTARGNLVAVVSNGTAVLGLGNLGAAASKPVMEGRGFSSNGSPGSTSSTWRWDRRTPRTSSYSASSWSPRSAGSTRRTSVRRRASSSNGCSAKPWEFRSFTTTSTVRPSSPVPRF